MDRKGIFITGIWLRTLSGQGVEVLVEIDGKWRVCIKDGLSGLTSHIIEPLGIEKAPIDTFTIE